MTKIYNQENSRGLYTLNVLTRHLNLPLIVAGFLFFGLGDLQAQNAQQPVEIEADDGIEWVQQPESNSGYYRASGNAVAKQGGMTLKSQELVAYYRNQSVSASDSQKKKQDLYQIEAEGEVVVSQGDAKAFGDRGVYHMDQNVAVLVGRNLRLTDPRATITATESLEFWSEKNIAVARGNALIVADDKRMKAGVMTAFIQENQQSGKAGVTRIDATGGVHISTPTEIVTAREGVYDLNAEVATICGAVKITRGDNQLNGECAEVNMKTGHSKILGGKGRVKGLIFNQ